MNEDDASELALLVDRWSDGELPADERAALAERLERDAGFARAFVAERRLRGQLAGLLADAGGEALWARVDAVVRAATETGRHRFADRVDARVAERGRARASRGRRPARLFAWWPAALAATAALVVVFILATREPRSERPAPAPIAVAPTPSAPVQPALAAIRSCAGATIDGNPARGGTLLRASQVLGTGADGAATLVYDDGTRIELGPASSLALADEGGAKRLRLERGTLSASVAKQPAGRAMRLATPISLATVVGTRFTLGCDGASSELAVSEGRVAFAPSPGGDGVEVAAGESARVADGTVAKHPSAQARLLAARPAIEPREDELGWTRIGWSTDLWAARRAAAESRKPLLLWVSWGDPLGMASSEGVADRLLWNDAELARLARERFVPVAIDSWYLGKRRDAVGAFFTEVVARAGDRSNTHDGIYCLAPDGTLLGHVGAGGAVDEARSLLAKAAGAQIARADIPDPGPADARYTPTPPADALRLDVFSRALAPAGEGWSAAGACGRDHAWLSRDEWSQLLPAAPRAGERIAVPGALASKLARFHLLDCARGEAVEWDEGDVSALELALIVDEASPARLRLRIEGSARLVARQRGYSPTIAGEIVAESGRITAFALVAIGEHRGGDLVDGGGSGGTRLGVAMRLSGDQPLDRVPPHGMRDVGYLPR